MTACALRRLRSNARPTSARPSATELDREPGPRGRRARNQEHDGGRGAQDEECDPGDELEAAGECGGEEHGIRAGREPGFAVTADRRLAKLDATVGHAAHHDRARVTAASQPENGGLVASVDARARHPRPTRRGRSAHSRRRGSCVRSGPTGSAASSAASATGAPDSPPSSRSAPRATATAPRSSTNGAPSRSPTSTGVATRSRAG